MEKMLERTKEEEKFRCADRRPDCPLTEDCRAHSCPSNIAVQFTHEENYMFAEAFSLFPSFFLIS